MRSELGGYAVASPDLTLDCFVLEVGSEHDAFKVALKLGDIKTLKEELETLIEKHEKE